MSWNAIHVYYYDDNKDHLLLHGIRPVIEWLRTTCQEQRIYLKRHWKLGPHVALYVDCDADRFAKEYFPAVKAQLERYLAEHPSTHVLDAEKFIQQSKTLGAWELEAGPYEPLCPNNSVVVQPYLPKVELLNGTSTVEIIENFMVASLDVILDTVEQAQAGIGKRYELLIKMMTVIAELFPFKDITRGHMSYRSHVESYLTTFDKNGTLLAMFQAREQEFGALVDQWLKSVLDHTDAEGVYRGEERLLQAWSSALAEMRQVVYPLAKEGTVNARNDHYVEMAQKIGEDAMQRWGGNPREMEKSEFHEALLSRKSADGFLNSPEFSTYRILVNSFYALLPVLGINPHAKHLLCYLVANSVERVTGFSWREFFAGIE